MTKGGGVGPRALLSAGGRVYGGCLHGFSDLIAAIAALGVASAVPAIGPLLPIILFLVFEIIIALAVGVVVGELLAVGPNELAVNVYIGVALVVLRIVTKAKELRAGGIVALRRGRAASDVEDVLEVPHVAVIDAQCLLVESVQPIERFRIERAVFHVDGNVMAARTEIGVDLDHPAADLGVKRAAIERHDRRTVRPDSVVVARGVERRVHEHCSLVSPKARMAVDDATVDDGVVRMAEAKVVVAARIQCHVLKRNGIRILEGVVAVILGTLFTWVRNLGTNLPRGLVGAGAHKREFLTRGVAIGGHTV